MRLERQVVNPAAFGFDEFGDKLPKALQYILLWRTLQDLLMIMADSGGRHLCYMIAGLLRPLLEGQDADFVDRDGEPTGAFHTTRNGRPVYIHYVGRADERGETLYVIFLYYRHAADPEEMRYFVPYQFEVGNNYRPSPVVLCRNGKVTAVVQRQVANEYPTAQQILAAVRE
jgi:hypothetical protein